jgi:hypothetical protein
VRCAERVYCTLNCIESSGFTLYTILHYAIVSKRTRWWRCWDRCTRRVRCIRRHSAEICSCLLFYACPLATPRDGTRLSYPYARTAFAKQHSGSGMTGTPEKGHLMLRAPFLKQPVHLRVLAILDGIRLLWFWCCERWRFAQSAIRLLEAAIQAVECSGWIRLRLLVSLQLGHSYLPDTPPAGRRRRRRRCAMTRRDFRLRLPVIRLQPASRSREQKSSKQKVAYLPIWSVSLLAC